MSNGAALKPFTIVTSDTDCDGTSYGTVRVMARDEAHAIVVGETVGEDMGWERSFDFYGANGRVEYGAFNPGLVLLDVQQNYKFFATTRNVNVYEVVPGHDAKAPSSRWNPWVEDDTIGTILEDVDSLYDHAEW